MRTPNPYSTPTRKGGAMKWVLILGLLLALVVASCASMFLVPFMLRQQRFNDDLLWLDRLLAVAWRLVPLAAIIMGLRIVWRRLGWTESVRADKQIDLYRAIAPALAGSARVLPPAQIIDQVQPVEALPPPAPSLPDVVDLDAVLNRFTPSFDRILLAVGVDNNLITVPVKHLWHIGLAGPTGAGKSNIARLITAQLLKLGANVIIADPKWTPFDREANEDWRPVAERLYRPAAYKAVDIEDLITWALEELDQRLERRNRGEKLGQALFLYLDEFTTITADVKDAEAKIARLARIGRGVGMFLIMAGHNFLVKHGGGDTRDQVRTSFYLGGDLKTGSVLLDMPQRDLVTQETELGHGVALLRSVATPRATLVRAPLVSNESLYTLLPSREARRDMGSAQETRGSENDVLPRVSQNDQTHAENSNRAETADPTSHAVKRASDASTTIEPEKFYGVKYLTMKGATKREILKEVWGITGGRRFAAAAAEYDAIKAMLDRDSL
jgi:DNA segregation ATPase FtsK/SpoIIIE-like protein